METKESIEEKTKTFLNEVSIMIDMAQKMYDYGLIRSYDLTHIMRMERLLVQVIDQEDLRSKLREYKKIIPEHGLPVVKSWSPYGDKVITEYMYKIPGISLILGVAFWVETTVEEFNKSGTKCKFKEHELEKSFVLVCDTGE